MGVSVWCELRSTARYQINSQHLQMTADSGPTLQRVGPTVGSLSATAEFGFRVFSSALDLRLTPAIKSFRSSLKTYDFTSV